MTVTDASKWFDILTKLHAAGGIATKGYALYNIAVTANPTGRRCIQLTYRPEHMTEIDLELLKHEPLTTNAQAIQFLRSHLSMPEIKS